jgi:hypothetical protein
MKSKYFYPVLRQHCDEKGLIELETCYLIYDPVNYKIQEAKESLKELMMHGFIAIGRRTDIQSKKWIIRILPWYGKFPVLLPFKFSNKNNFKKIPSDFYEGNNFLPNQFSADKEEIQRVRKLFTKEDVQEIYNHWKKVTGRSKSRLTENRKHQIRKGLKKYSVKKFKMAINGWQYSKFHCGDNSNNIVYDDIKYVLRNFDAFLQLEHKFGV